MRGWGREAGRHNRGSRTPKHCEVNQGLHQHQIYSPWIPNYFVILLSEHTWNIESITKNAAIVIIGGRSHLCHVVIVLLLFLLGVSYGSEQGVLIGWYRGLFAG